MSLYHVYVNKTYYLIYWGRSSEEVKAQALADGHKVKTVKFVRNAKPSKR